MKAKLRVKCFACAFALYFLISTQAVHAQTDIQQTVREFLQAWYVDRKSPDELRNYIAKDNGFHSPSNTTSKAPVTAARVDPVQQLFTGAFTRVPVGSESVRPKTLSDAIEYAPAKRPSTARATGQTSCLTSTDFAICKPDQLPKGTVLPTTKPSGNDPVANYLWHLSDAYKNKLYIVLYSTKGAGLLRETAILYWIQEGKSWKLAAFQGTNW